MPFYFRKSIRAGPFRFNLSQSGVGMSVGVRGLRVGTGPRGHYIRAGVGGFYYQAALGRAGQKNPAPVALPVPTPQYDHGAADAVTLIEVASADATAMREVPFAAVLDEINAAQSKTSKAALFGGTGLAATAVLFGMAPQAWLFGLLASGLAWAVGRWLDSYQRTAVLFYDLDATTADNYAKLTAAFDDLCTCKGIWHVEAGGQIHDLTTWKRNAGASKLVRKKIARLSYTLPRVLKCNVTPPCFQLGSRALYLLPDAVFILQGKKVGAVSYAHLIASNSPSRFIEDGSVPQDATIVAHTWQHPNRNGGPDRRYAQNRQIPICLYDELALQSHDGLNELIELSRMGAASGFVSVLEGLRNHETPAALAQAVDQSIDTPVPGHPMITAPPSPERSWPGRLAAVLAAFALFGWLANDSDKSPPTPPKPHAPISQHAKTSPPGQPSRPASLGVPAAPSGPLKIAPKPTPVPERQSLHPNASAPATSAKTLYTKNRVNLRATPSTSGVVIRSVDAGLAVTAYDEFVGWHRVRIGNQEGWIRSDLVAPTLPSRNLAPSSIPAPPITTYVAPSAPVRAPAGSPIRQPFVGRCDCPYDMKRNGAMCGASSAYSKPGGRSPACYN